MCPDERNLEEQVHALAAEGRFFAALLTRMEHLRVRAHAFLGDLNIKVVNDPNSVFRSLAEEYSVHSEVLAEEIARRDADLSVEVEREEDLTEEEWIALQLRAVHSAKLNAVALIYRSLANFLHEIAQNGPVDAQRLAKIMLIAMDLAYLSYFCTQIDDLPETIERERIARVHSQQQERRAAGARVSNSIRSSWHDVAIVGAEVFQHYNPLSKQKEVKRKVASFVEQVTGAPFAKYDGLEKVLRDPEKRRRARLVVKAHLEGELIDDPRLADALSKALKAFVSDDPGRS